MHAAETITSRSLAEQIRSDIEGRKVRLPTLPEVALQVRDAIESDSAGADTVARVIGRDAALSVRLLQVANSPLYPGNHRIDSLVHAVARLGLQLVRTLVTSLAMRQVFQAHSTTLAERFRAIWEDSREVAAISQLLADNVPGLENEQAMLGGLIHNIGALPVLTRIDECYGRQVDEALVSEVISEIGPCIGDLILKRWHFAESLANIPSACQDLGYDPGPVPTYADIVLVARLQHLLCKGGTEVPQNWGRAPAFAKLGIQTEDVVMDVDQPGGRIAEVRRMLEV
jgi:HD-like signal output (HDOD) protein